MPSIPIVKAPPMIVEEMQQRIKALGAAWEIVDDQKLRRVFTFPTFQEAIAFVNKIAQLADERDHHPDIQIQFKTVVLELWTHSASGITDKDFQFAQEINTNLT